MSPHIWKSAKMPIYDGNLSREKFRFIWFLFHVKVLFRFLSFIIF